MLDGIHINPELKFKLSPYLYMQFMEPLGTADSSVDAGWDYLNDCWRPELLETVRYLAPSMVRWGGCFASFQHWKEGVGPREQRVPMLNLCWDGVYSNQVGTGEVVDFCRETGAEPLFTVNMEADGRMKWAYPKGVVSRLGNSEEAAEWVDYCNNPDNAERHSHGAKEPYNVKYWQIGNETSYDPSGFNCEKAAAVTLEFARKMRIADPSIKLIAWGDSGWAARMCQVAGDVIDYVALHHHFNFWDEGSPLFNLNYRKEDYALVWENLINAFTSLQAHIDEVREEISPYRKRIAITEGHFDIKSRNRSDLLSSWAAGVAYGRCLNVLERNGDIVDIATMADFFGNRWQVNAVMIPTPHGKRRPYLQPVGWVMSLFRRHMGEHAVSVKAPSGLDISVSRTGKRLFLHAVNINMDKAVKSSIKVEGMNIKSGTVYEIKADPQLEITEFTPDLFSPSVREMKGSGWEFPAASVTAMELELESVNEG